MRPEGSPPLGDVPGKVAEWSKAPDSKSGVRFSVPWVRIPPFPPNEKNSDRRSLFLLAPAFLRLCLTHVRTSRDHRAHPSAATGARTALVRAGVDCFACPGISRSFRARCAGTGGDSAVDPDGKAGAGRDGAASQLAPRQPSLARAPPKPAPAPRPALTKPDAAPQPAPQPGAAAESEKSAPPSPHPNLRRRLAPHRADRQPRQARPSPRRRRKAASRPMPRPSRAAR